MKVLRADLQRVLDEEAPCDINTNWVTNLYPKVMEHQVTYDQLFEKLDLHEMDAERKEEDAAADSQF